jgi:hypothetical protein
MQRQFLTYPGILAPPNRTSTLVFNGIGLGDETQKPTAEMSRILTAAMSPVVFRTENSVTGYLGSARRCVFLRCSERDID